MLNLVHIGKSLPTQFICDPSVEFQPGQIAELTVIGNQVMATVSQGSGPVGIIDDARTRSFTNISWNEEIIVPINTPGGTVSNPTVPFDIKVELKKPNIVSNSFTSSVNVTLNPVNGVITFLAGTPLNFSITGGSLDSIRAVVSYTYFVANIPGEDTTMGSGMMTVWIERGIFSTNMYETNQQYAVRANLFVSEIGLVTTRQPTASHPAIGMVTGPPSTISPLLEFLWY